MRIAAALKSVLCPERPRFIRGHRWLGVALRTAHLMTFGTVVGGHVFDVDPARLVPFLALTIASGVGLVALELSSTCAWIFTGKGLAVFLKLLLLLLVPVFWEHRVLLLFTAVAVAGVGSHMPARFRHRLFFVTGTRMPASRASFDVARK